MEHDYNTKVCNRILRNNMKELKDKIKLDCRDDSYYSDHIGNYIHVNRVLKMLSDGREALNDTRVIIELHSNIPADKNEFNIKMIESARYSLNLDMTLLINHNGIITKIF